MRYLFLILIFLSAVLKAQFVDNFADGNFTDNPQWTGTTDLFTINTEMALQLDAPAEAGQAWLFTESQAIEEAQWNFYFQMNFNPSANNYCKIYLTADTSDITFINNAYYLELGTTADNICLWKIKNGAKQKLIDGIAKRLDMNTVFGLIRVKRDKQTIVLESAINNGEWTEEGRCENTEGMVSNYFGLSCHYTQTRNKHFIFDDFVVTGEAFKDTVPVFTTKRNDVIISEIMYRPSPTVQLPNSQYIELYNRSEFPVQLEDFTLKVGSRTTVLKKYLLYPNDYLLLVPSNQDGNWSFVFNRLSVTNWSTMLVGGADIILTDKHENTIAVLQYSPDMGEQGFKQTGGWSLEIRDVNNLSGDWDNFDFSVDISGGTPGLANSVAANFPDIKSPTLIDWYVQTDCLIMEFSEPLNPEKLPYNCIIEPSELNIDSIKVEEPFLKTV
jgi:hypothetical protein